MKIVAASVIMALGIGVAGFFAGGRYEIIGSTSNTIIRLDRYTGEVSMCVPGMKGDSCGFILDPPARNSN
ncbi:hypothetical protein FHS85_004014 [Rhodoligotrophos appendicifer]|uniref:hypothetical protein n=1 Tax=Rhodoligotrophos appendicifer TaxID=987056 RepID=UPI001186EE94|nr:hypothetical protein [Rhodoligotrophos appendicifer]